MPQIEEVRFLFAIVAIVLFIFLIFILGLIYLFKQRQNQLLLKNELEEEQYKNEILNKEIENQQNINRERERISEDIHDDIGGILSAIKLQTEFILTKTIDTDFKSSLSTISENSSIAISRFREMIWCLHSRNDTLEEFIVFTSQFITQFCEKTKIQSKVDYPLVIDDIEMSSFIRRQLILVIKELYTNILKHSLATKALFNIEILDNNLKIQITDNGKGMHPESKKGNGIFNISKRIQSINGNIEYFNLTKGTEVIILIPL